MRWTQFAALFAFFAAAGTGCSAAQGAVTAAPQTLAITPVLSPVSTLPEPVAIAPEPTQLALIEGTTVTRVNVRAQPAMTGEVLGILEPAVKIRIAGKDAGGGWYQILYVDSYGWVSAEYARVESDVVVPFVATAVPVVVSPPAAQLVALPDGDSQNAPLATALFSPIGTQAVQVNGEVSAPNGDAEDWLQFIPDGNRVALRVECVDGWLTIELWGEGGRMEGFSLACGNETLRAVVPGGVYALRFSAALSGEYHYVRYTAFINSVK